MRLMRHGLVGRLPRPANGDHARGAATMLQSAVVPTAAAPQSETMFVHSERWHNDQLGRSENFRSFRCVFRLRGRCVLMEPSALRWSRRSSRPFSSLQPTSMPAPRRGTKTRQSVSNIASSNGIIDISLPIEAKAATVDRGRINDASNACSQAVVPLRAAGRRTSAFCSSRSQPARPIPFQLALLLITCPYRSLYHGSIAWKTEHGVWVGHNGRVTILQSLSDMMRRPGIIPLKCRNSSTHSMRVPVSLRPLTGARL